MKKKNKKRFKVGGFSLVNKLTHEGVLTKELLVLLNTLTLEDIIAIKLELASIYIGNRLQGLNLWTQGPYMISDALLKFALSASGSKVEAAKLLGISYAKLVNQLFKYQTVEFFEEQSNYNK